MATILDPHGRRRPVARRALLRGAVPLAAALAGAGRGRMAVAAHSGPVATPAPGAGVSAAALAAFADDVETALDTFAVPGAAVAVVHGDEVVFDRGFGARDLAGNAPVTPRTLFRVGSLAKPMTTLLLAGLVDEGAFAWDDRAIDLWPGFRAPTPELTDGLRLRDLVGMGSGLAESATVGLDVVEFFVMAGDRRAADILCGVADQAVIGAPGTVFSYNNTLVASAAFLGLLATGTPPADLLPAYAARLSERVFVPLGMTGATLADDPRPLSDDVSLGYARDLFGQPQPLPFVALDGLGPAGSGFAGSTDLARFLIAQMNGGVAADGTRVVSAAGLADLHAPGVLVPPGELVSPELQPDTESLHYAKGWLVQRFRDGRRLVWHAGGIDGFDAFVGFLPEERLGLVILTNADHGSIFNLAVLYALLGRLFGLNRELPAALAALVPMLDARAAELAARVLPFDPAAAPRPGLYQDGFRLRLADDGLRLDHDIRSFPLLPVAEGGYLIGDGPAVVNARSVAFAVDPGGVPVMTVDGFRPVRWLTGG